MIVARGLGRGAFLGTIVAAGFGLSLVTGGSEPAVFPRSDIFSTTTRADALLTVERAGLFTTTERVSAFAETHDAIVITAGTRADVGSVAAPVSILPTTPGPDLAPTISADEPAAFFSLPGDSALYIAEDDRTDIITTPAPAEIATGEDRSDIG